MKKRRITAALFGAAAIVLFIAALFFAVSGVAALLYASFAVVAVAVVFSVVAVYRAVTPTQYERHRINMNRCMPFREVDDYALELNEMRAAFVADKKSDKNTIPFCPMGAKQYIDPMVADKGELYYAAVVEAGEEIYRQSYKKLVVPAVVVYSTDIYYDLHPEELRSLADRVFADWRNNFLGESGIGYFVNRPLRGYDKAGREVYATTVMLYRPHLPMGYLSGWLIPILSEPSMCTSTLAVDCKYWTDNFVAAFVRNNVDLKRQMLRASVPTMSEMANPK